METFDVTTEGNAGGNEEDIMETVLVITERNAGGDEVEYTKPRDTKNASVRSVRSWGEDIMETIDVTTEGHAGGNKMEQTKLQVKKTREDQERCEAESG